MAPGRRREARHWVQLHTGYSRLVRVRRHRRVPRASHAPTDSASNYSKPCSLFDPPLAAPARVPVPRGSTLPKPRTDPGVRSNIFSVPIVRRGMPTSADNLRGIALLAGSRIHPSHRPGPHATGGSGITATRPRWIQSAGHDRAGRNARRSALSSAPTIPAVTQRALTSGRPPCRPGSARDRRDRSEQLLVNSAG
jgi:hypothetical protein